MYDKHTWNRYINTKKRRGQILTKTIRTREKHAELDATRGGYLGKFLSCTAALILHMSTSVAKETNQEDHSLGRQTRTHCCLQACTKESRRAETESWGDRHQRAETTARARARRTQARTQDGSGRNCHKRTPTPTSSYDHLRSAPTTEARGITTEYLHTEVLLLRENCKVVFTTWRPCS
jgi:hypothetical protein